MPRLLTCLLGLATVFSAFPARAAEKTPDVAAVARQVVEQTNAFRETEGLKPVKVDDALAKTAQYFADFMARTDEYGHEADGKTPADRAEKNGYDYVLVLENIAWQLNTAGFKTDELSAAFVKAWQDSPGHRKNMLDPDVTQTGVAVARGAKSGKYYAVQMFGSPKSAALTVEISNQSSRPVKYEIGGKAYTIDPRYTRTHTLGRSGEVVFAGGKKASFKFANGSRYTIRPDGSIEEQAPSRR